MGRFMGIDFAPLNVPLERRLQTFAASILSLGFFVFGPFSLFVYIVLLFTKYYYVPLIYSLWLWYDADCCDHGGRRWNWIKNLKFWKYMNNYFPVHLIKTAELDTNKNYIIACHPHGMACCGVFSCFANGESDFFKLYPGIRITGLTIKVHFLWPFAREFLLASGACSTSKRSFQYLLTKQGMGNGIVLVPGGSAEVYESHPGTACVILKNRKGFIKIAIKYGACLVPVYSFGETDLFSPLHNPKGSLIREIQERFKNIFGFPLFLFNGRGYFQYTFGIFPRRLPIYTVVGNPIEVEKDDNPSEETIDKYHSLYIDSLQKMFDEYKVKVGEGRFKDQVLQIK